MRSRPSRRWATREPAGGSPSSARCRSTRRRPDTYRPIAKALEAAADRVVAVGRAGPPLERLLAQTSLAARLLQVPDAEAAAVALSAELGPGDVALLHGAGHHDLELIGLRLDPDTDPAWVEDWRLRPLSRVGRPVTEVLAVVGADATPRSSSGTARP